MEYRYNRRQEILKVEICYQKGSTIITTLIKPPELKDLFDDLVIAETIGDRLVSIAHVFDIKDNNYRKKKSPKEKIAIEMKFN